MSVEEIIRTGESEKVEFKEIKNQNWVYYFASGLRGAKARLFAEQMMGKKERRLVIELLAKITKAGALTKFITGLGPGIEEIRNVFSKLSKQTVGEIIEVLKNAGASQRHIKMLTGRKPEQRKTTPWRIRGVLERVGKEEKKLFSDFKEKIVRGKKAKYLVTIGLDALEAPIGFGICAITRTRALKNGPSIYFPRGWTISRSYQVLGRVKFNIRKYEGKKVLCIDAIQGVKTPLLSRLYYGSTPKELLNDFSSAVEKPWPVYLVEQLTDICRKKHMHGIAIVIPNQQAYLKKGDETHKEALRRASGLYSRTAKHLGFREKRRIGRKEYYFKEL